MTFTTIIGTWHIWEAQGPSIMLSNEDTKKLYTASDIDQAVTLLYMEGGKVEGRKLWAEWQEHKAQALTVGTSHFVSLEAAFWYYKAYGHIMADVQRMIRTKEIHIGKPAAPKGSKVVLLADEGRYAIQSA